MLGNPPFTAGTCRSRNTAFVAFLAWVLLAWAFRAGLDHLLDVGRNRRCVIMCSEAVWWRCHRRIVADYLIAAGETVFHILGPGHIEPARLTEGAVVQSDGAVLYPAPDMPEA